MVSQEDNIYGSPLKVVTLRLAVTSKKQLPRVIPQLANLISNCKELSTASENQKRPRDASGSGVLIHKFKTQISTLLNDKSVESRWSAVVLIKAIVEVGGWEVLQGVGAWTKGLIGILTVCVFCQWIVSNMAQSKIVFSYLSADLLTCCKACPYCNHADIHPETRSCNYQKVVYHHSYEDLLARTGVSDSAETDSDSFNSSFHHKLSKSCFD